MGESQRLIAQNSKLLQPGTAASGQKRHQEERHDRLGEVLGRRKADGQDFQGHGWLGDDFGGFTLANPASLTSASRDRTRKDLFQAAFGTSRWRAHAAAPSQDTDDGGRLTSFGRHRQLVFAPSGWVPDVTSRELPNVTLEREHVHGMDGSCPGTVHFVGEDRCIYIAARLCVVEDMVITLDLRESRQTFFEGHNSDVLCLSYSEAHHLAISGQQDPPGEGCPFACVWSPSFPSRPLAELRCYQERKGGNPPPRLQYGSDSSYIDLPPEFDPKTMVEVPLRSIVSVAIASNGRFAAMSALDEKKSICLYHLPADVATRMHCRKMLAVF
eukprot:s3227_g1.t1